MNALTGVAFALTGPIVGHILGMRDTSNSKSAARAFQAPAIVKLLGRDLADFDLDR